MSAPLRRPPGVTAPAAGATTREVEVYSAKVQRAWVALMKKAPVAAAREYQALRDAPFTIYPGRRFPRKGKQNKGVWESEPTGADRVLYTEQAGKVIVLYVGDYH